MRILLKMIVESEDGDKPVEGALVHFGMEKRLMVRCNVDFY